MKTIVKQRSTTFTTKEMVTIGLLAGLAYVLMFLRLPFKYLGFLEIEFSDIPAVFAALQFGPFAGVIVELVKNLIKALTATTTGTVGELANFIISIAYVIPVGILYKLKKGSANTKAKNTLKSDSSNITAVSQKYLYLVFIFAVGTFCMTLTGAILNYFVTIPLYATLFGGMSVVVGSAAKFLPIIKDINTLVFLGITPFNIVKGIGMSVIGYYTFYFLRNRL